METDARGTRTPGIAARLKAPSRDLSHSGAEQPARMHGIGERTGKDGGSEAHGTAPEGGGGTDFHSVPQPGGSADAFTRVARPGRKMAARALTNHAAA